MIKLHASYSKKIPAEEQYSSKSFHASLEIEVADDVAADNGKLQERLRFLWNDLEQAVEAQISGSNGKPAPQGQAQTPENGDDRASPRQINYLTLLARRAKGWGLAELETHLKTRFGNGGVYDLSKGDASMLIEELKSAPSDQGSRR